MEVLPKEKEENQGGTDEEYTDMEGEAISEPDAPTDTTATATEAVAVNEGGAAKVVARAGDNRGDRRAT